MPTTMNDYERRFQRSLQKLTIPTWYAETIPSAGSKQSIVSNATIPWRTNSRESSRTPEIVHVRRPHSYRSCRSSLAASPSPSMHSWHPHHLTDGMNFSLLVPSASSRRQNKYQKGIERVCKSSRWYRPTQFAANAPINEQTAIAEVSTATKHNHYDTPKKIPSATAHLVSHDDVRESPLVNNNITAAVKVSVQSGDQQDNHIKSHASQEMPPVDLIQPFGAIELEETTDKREQLLQRAASDLVDTVLADILLMKTLDDPEDRNSGVRELSEDENGLRELNEDDMSDMDEFIVFATQPQTSDEPQFHLNRLYTFSKQSTSNQNSPRSMLNSDLTVIRPHAEQPFDQLFHTSPIYRAQHSDFDRFMCPSTSQSVAHQSSAGVNEDTARIGRLLLDRISISLNENILNLSPTPTLKNVPSVGLEQDHYQSPIIEEYDHEFHDEARPDSAYSSNQERIHIQQSLYEPLSECYSGYSFIQSDFLTPNISSIQSTTDEAYESEPTTMSSSIAMTSHVHPDLEHEFDYPPPPPPVPDRRLKPAYLKTSPPPTKPRPSKQDHIDSMGYSIVQKSKPLSATTIQQFLRPTSNDSSSSPTTKTMSSRHYCGIIPGAKEEATESSTSPSPIKLNEYSKDKTKEKRNSRALNCLHPSTTDDDRKGNFMIKSSSSLNKAKTKKSKLIPDFDEATNGLAIRLPAPESDGYSITKPSNRNRTSTPLSTKRANLTTNQRPPFFETSV